MRTYKGFRGGDLLYWINNDFEYMRGFKVPCIVTKAGKDYAIATTRDGMELQIDDDTIAMFERR